MAEELTLRVSHKPIIDVTCTFITPSTSSSVSNKTLLVFLNGIDNSASLWFPTISTLQKQRKELPAMLCYDRPGQGKSPRFEPKKEVKGRPRGYGRNCVDAAIDLRAIVTQIASLKLQDQTRRFENGVGSSISRRSYRASIRTDSYYSRVTGC